MAPRKQIMFLVLSLIGVLLMIGSGLAVYFMFCIQPESGTGFSSISTNSSINNSSNTKCPSVAPPIDCPGRPICEKPPLCPAPAAVLCPPKPTPACLPCPTHPPCTQENCLMTCPPVNATTTPKPVILTEQEIYSVRPLDLIRRYPVNSFERLQVVIQLMQAGSEYYFKTFTSRNCHYDVRRVCKYCTDRYQFLRCVMKNDVKGLMFPNSYHGNRLLKEPAEFPQEFRRRVWESAKSYRYNYPGWPDYGLHDRQYGNRWANHVAMSFWWDKDDNGNFKECTACSKDVRHVDHMNCIIYSKFDWEYS